VELLRAAVGKLDDGLEGVDDDNGELLEDGRVAWEWPMAV
jgi:hypothetical protein